jgi:hypothetical protein
MKNYIRPNIEVSKFDVADIITVSGAITPVEDMSPAMQSLYSDYVAKSGVKNTDVAVFEW